MNYHQYNPSCPVIVGCGAVSVLGDKIKEFGCKKPLICCDEGIKSAGIVDKVTASLTNSGIDYGVFSGVKPDPTAAIVDAG